MFSTILVCLLAGILLSFLLRKASQLCYHIADALGDKRRQQDETVYLKDSILQERKMKEKILNDVRTSKYLTPEYLMTERPTDQTNKEDQVKVSELLKSLDTLT